MRTYLLQQQVPIALRCVLATATETEPDNDGAAAYGYQDSCNADHGACLTPLMLLEIGI